MGEKRFWFGFVVTVIWLSGLTVAAFCNLDALNAMRPNEWGDLLGGSFAPLAFLWLVLGYLQQGKELQLSTEALLLQAKELRHSVDQQKELVEVSRAQLENDRETNKQQMLERTRAAKPQFSIHHAGGVSSSSGTLIFTLSFINGGSAARSVVGVVTGLSGGNPNIINIPICQSQLEYPISLQIVGQFPESNVTLRITYIDAFGADGETIFSVSMPVHNYLVFNEIES